jgi:hypothetical protein
VTIAQTGISARVSTCGNRHLMYPMLFLELFLLIN